MSGKQPLSPQGYNIGTDPKNFNPFWEQVQGSGIGDVTASAETVPPHRPRGGRGYGDRQPGDRKDRPVVRLQDPRRARGSGGNQGAGD